MKRRDFFKLTVGAAAGMLLPEIVLPAVASEPERVPITMQWMQYTYGSLWYGSQHPTVIYFSLSRWEELRNKIVASHRFTYQSPKRTVVSFRFNGADVCWSNNVDDNTAFFINEDQPMDTRLSRKLAIGDFWKWDVNGNIKIEKHL